MLLEPVFEDKPLGESSWGNLVGVIQQVNRLKAQLLVSLYEETRIAYQKYKTIRDQAIADYIQQKDADAVHNQAIDQQISQLEEELRALEGDYYQERSAMQREWADAYRKARIEAGKYGVNLHGNALIELDSDMETEMPTQAVVESPMPLSTSAPAESATDPAELQQRRSFWRFLFGSRSDSTPAQSGSNSAPNPLTEPSRATTAEAPTSQRSHAFISDPSLPAVASTPPVPSREAIREEIKQALREEFQETLTAIGRAMVEPTDEPAPLTESEVIAREDLPAVSRLVLAPWLWWLLVVITGSALGLLTSVALGISLSDWQNPLLWIASVLGVTTSVLLVSALWGASAIVGELYHLFAWTERKSAKASWLVGITWVIFLMFISGLFVFLVRTVWLMSVGSPLHGVILTFVGLMALAMIQGFLHGRLQWVGHRIRAQMDPAERDAYYRRRAERETRVKQFLEWLAGHEQQANPTTPPPSQEHADPHRQASPAVAPTHDDPAQGVPNGIDSLEGFPIPASANAGRANGQADAEPSPRSLPSEVLAQIAETRALNNILRKMESDFVERKQELQARIEQLRRERRPIYMLVSPEGYQTVCEASRTWARYYVHFLDVLTQALQECKDGAGLTESTRRLMNEITRTYLQGPD